MRSVPDTVELTQKLLINAIAFALKERYGYRIYAKELKQGFSDPCFFIEALPSHSRRIGSRRLKRLQAFTIHFFPSEADEPESVGEELYSLLELVQVSEKVFNGNSIHCRGSGMTYNVVDGVLHFSVNYNYHLLEEKLYPHMEALVQSIAINGGNDG